MEMRIHKGRRHQQPLRINDPRGLCRDIGLKRGNAPVPTGNIEPAATIGQGRVLDNQVKTHGGCPLVASCVAGLALPVSPPSRRTFARSLPALYQLVNFSNVRRHGLRMTLPTLFALNLEISHLVQQAGGVAINNQGLHQTAVQQRKRGFCLLNASGQQHTM